MSTLTESRNVARPLRRDHAKIRSLDRSARNRAIPSDENPDSTRRYSKSARYNLLEKLKQRERSARRAQHAAQHTCKTAAALDTSSAIKPEVSTRPVPATHSSLRDQRSQLSSRRALASRSSRCDQYSSVAALNLTSARRSTLSATRSVTSSATKQCELPRLKQAARFKEGISRDVQAARWLADNLEDFGLSSVDLFAVTRDGGSDIKWTMKTGFGVAWEWCVAHMANVATKHAFGLVLRQSSHNPDLTGLVADIQLTIRLVWDVNVMGDLFEALCELEGSSRSVQLLDYRSHRFTGLARVIERVLEKWTPLVEWF
ncbi:hypothetical protein PybrP1_003769 [[Pythium] brassicae (nom. inval.)]|nr:hypothetical protein PybrP1_003769 [[Pythium] brassicae (nom. inval.)]